LLIGASIAEQGQGQGAIGARKAQRGGKGSPIAGLLTEVRQRWGRFLAKNEGARAIVAGKMKELVLSWAICAGCSVRNLVSDRQKVAKTWKKLARFG